MFKLEKHEFVKIERASHEHHNRENDLQIAIGQKKKKRDEGG